MSYSLYITRAESWLDSEQTPIEEDEWLKIVKRDKLPLSEDCPGTYAVLAKGKEVGWLSWEKGRIESGWPNDETFFKMLSMARRLNARIEGEAHEHYDTLKDWRLANDRDARVRKFEHRWAPFKQIAERLMDEAGYEQVADGVWWRANSALPVHDKFNFWFYQDGDEPGVRVSWGFWFDFAPNNGAPSSMWKKKSPSMFDYTVQVKRDELEAFHSRTTFLPRDAHGSAKARCEKKLQAVIAEAETLFHSVRSLQDLLVLYTEQKRNLGSSYDFSWACVLIALGKINDGMRKLNHFLKRYRYHFSADDVVPKMIRKLGEHRGPLERAWERRSGTTQRKKKK